MKTLALGLCLMFLIACVPQTEFIPDGHFVIQHTYTRNFWTQNVSHVTRCLKTEVEQGGCKATDTRQTERLEMAQAPGPQVVSAVFLGASIVGGAALMMHGLQTQRVSQPNPSIGTQYVSTQNNNPQYVPITLK